MSALQTLYNRLFDTLSRLAGNWLLPSFARFTFAATLLIYFWKSAQTKLGTGGGLGRLFTLDPSGNAHVQMFPKVMESLGYDPSALGFGTHVIAVLGTWGEFVLPLLIVLGLFTRAAALGMAVFIAVMTYVDITGHGAAFGAWFNNQSGELIADQRLFWYLLLAVLFVKGAGPVSLDRVLRLR